jgi:hypothetical protein
LYPIGSWTRLGDLANIASMELAEAQTTEVPAYALGDLSRACDDLMAHRAQVAKVATQQVLAARINLLRRTVKIVAPALLALCLLGLWLALQ